MRCLLNGFEIKIRDCQGFPPPMLHSTILGIESSCDDTAAAVWYKGKILANITAGQKVHEIYGGVVPELASRAHQSNIIPVIDTALKTANKSLKEIDAIACTAGPGLMGSLLVGLNTAKGLAMSLNIPFVGVDHLKAHIAALFIENTEPRFPLLVLLVSGGHTQIVLVESETKMEIVGRTLDDAAGEAFDKAAKLLGLGYPGGPVIDKLAAKGEDNKFLFPVSKLPALDMSFSGIKTALLYFLRQQQKNNEHFIEAEIENICASFQKAIVDSLMYKFNLAVKQYRPAGIGLAGGVSANSRLRNAVQNAGSQHRLPVYIPAFEFCTDNAAMIATAGAMMLKNGQHSDFALLPFSRHK